MRILTKQYISRAGMRERKSEVYILSKQCMSRRGMGEREREVWILAKQFKLTSWEKKEGMHILGRKALGKNKRKLEKKEDNGKY